MNTLSFDDILSKKIGFGSVQVRPFIVISLFVFLDGAEFMYLQLLNVLIYIEWSLNLRQLIILTTVYNFGQLIGALMQGKYSDSTGRKTMLVWVCLLGLIVMLFIVFVQNLISLYILCFLFGIRCGIGFPLATILMAESIPLHMRGQFVVALQMMQSIGRIWMIFLASFFLDSLSSGNWRAIALINIIPCIICLICCIFYVKESPRFIISKGDIQQGVEEINWMGQQNKGDQYTNLTDVEIQQLKFWRDETFQQQHQQKSFKELFNKENLPVTWRSYTMSIISMFMYSGLYVIIPFLFEKEDKGLIDIFYTIIAEVPVAIIVVLLIDRVGRLPLILIGISLSIVFAFIIWNWRIRHLLIGFIAFRFFNRMTFISISPLVVESYSTVYRSLGIGTTTAVGRVGGFVSSAIFFPLYNKDNYLPFFFSMLLFMILFFIFATFPRDLTNKPLDLRYDEEKKKDE